ncbi:MAG: DNA-binding response regulator, partial [Deltaproteobacteria bacterium]|nr:DNA-binding response regulator [Deltaproteobacteria bacterium]
MAEQVILVVEDEPDILEVVEFNLKQAGFKVIQAKDG